MFEARTVQLALGPMANFSYLIYDERTKFAAAIDPGWEAGRIEAEAKALGVTIDKILLTHTHFDHAGDLEKLAELTGATVYVHADEADDVPANLKVEKTEDGSTIMLGEMAIKCLHTPGHTPGSQCFVIDGAVFTGDTLFVDGCGRVDLPGGDAKKMLESLRKLSELNPTFIVYPGHDYGGDKSTIEEQRSSNPYMAPDVERIHF
jgi:hydroxyacylglutathione hydrolase